MERFWGWFGREKRRKRRVGLFGYRGNLGGGMGGFEVWGESELLGNWKCGGEMEFWGILGGMETLGGIKIGGC